MTPRTLARGLAAALAIASGAGLAAEIAYFRADVPAELVAFFSLSAEGNLPTWVATCILFSCSLVLASIASGVRARRERFLAAIFAYLSLDEATEIHEHLGGLVPGSGVFYFDWVIPASLFVIVVGSFYAPFLSHLDAGTRRRFVIAGVLYVGGALLMELPLGWWTEQHGDDNLGYAAMDWIEETLELVGASYFLVSLWKHRSERRA
jgi:hypothetical protein